MGKEKRVAEAAKPQASRRVPIKNAQAEHSFVISLVYLKDQGPVCAWSEDAQSLFRVLEYLGNRQRDQTATSPDKRCHYQTNKEKLTRKAHDWLAANPAVQRLDEYLWTFGVTNTHRIWGILTDNVFYLLWNDPKHEIYPYDIQDKSDGKRR